MTGSYTRSLMPLPGPPMPRWGTPVVSGMAAVLIGAIAVGFWVLTGGGYDNPTPTISSTPGMVSVVGWLTLADDNPEWKPGDECAGGPGYHDLRAGAPVVISNATGNAVGASDLSAGVARRSASRCRFTFSVTVPAGLGSYRIAIGAHDEFEVSEAGLRSAVKLSVGDDQPCSSEATARIP